MHNLARSVGRHMPANVASGTINFVASGNPSFARFCIVDKRDSVEAFTHAFLNGVDGIHPPEVLLSVTGGAQAFKMLSSKLEQIFSRGLLRAAQNTNAWIVTGGLSVGVMEFVGNAIRQMDVKVPCIGIAAFAKVSQKELFKAGHVDYSPEKRNDKISAALQPDHSHFILVKSDNPDWGEEIGFRNAFEDYVSNEWKVPLVLIAINGGPGTLKTVLEGVRKGFPIIIVEQSGRASDAMASYLKHAQDKRYELEVWDKFLADAPINRRAEYITTMQELAQNQDRIIIFNPNENAAEDMDKVILWSILRYNATTGFTQKMALGVQWGRVDMIAEMLEHEDEKVTTAQKLAAVNSSLQAALKLNRPEICELLIKKGADKDSINLNELYNLREVSYHVERLKPFAGLLRLTRSNRASSTINESTYLIEPTLDGWEIAKEILRKLDPIYARLLEDNAKTFTDALVWAIVVDRTDLAKAIWRHMDYPVHAALVACHLYSVLSEWFPGEEVYVNNKRWFENEALSVLSEADYDHAIPILKWQWLEMDNYDALRIAELAECKEFTAHPYVQRYLTEKLYYDEHGNIPPGTVIWRIFLLTIFPFLIPSSTSYCYNDNRVSPTRFYHFYSLPVVKMMTGTLCYICFLALVTLNLMECKPGIYHIRWYEILLWIWLFASIVEEAMQYFESTRLSDAYFNSLSNQMDLVMNAGLTIYVVLRILAWYYESKDLVQAYTDVLIVSTIMCYVRLMNVFAISKSLGPLFFVIVRLFKDVLQWFFIFFVFMMSFQTGIFALTRQAGEDPWATYPNGTLGVGFSTIIGEMGDNTMEYMERTQIGVVLLSLYALIAQVMLVNLLIAMMGDTYGTVKENADKEWKFYRYGLITEFITTSPYPPPLNLIFGPPFYLKYKFFPEEEANLKLKNTDKTVLHMQIAKEKALDKEREEEMDTISSLSGFMRDYTRLATAQSDGDRLALEYSLKNIQLELEHQAKESMTMQGRILAILNAQEQLQNQVARIAHHLQLPPPT